MMIYRKEQKEELKGRIFDIRRFSTHDGTGIRTCIFLKGCPLSCVWCHNPEGISTERFVMHFEKKCIKCGLCCSLSHNKGVKLYEGHIFIDPSKEEDWDRIVYECPAGAMAWNCREMSIDEVMEETMKDRQFFRYGGGVTLSGGEPLLQHDFALGLLKRLKEEGVDTAIETALYVKEETLEAVIPYLDTIYADFKIFSSESHKIHAGVFNERIKSNIRLLLQSEKRDRVIIRTPMIPGYTALDENIRDIARFITGIYPDVSYEILNYNPLAEAKYSLVGREYCFKDNPKRYTDEEMERFIEAARKGGVKNIVRE